MVLSTTPENAITLDAVIVKTGQKHKKTIVVLLSIAVLFSILYYITKSKATI